MYDLHYVKKRRRRKIAALVALFSSIAVTFFIVTSFLGRTLGTFTVSLVNSEVNLALCETKDSNKNSTYLRVNANSRYVEHSYEDFKGVLDTLDDENAPKTLGEYSIPYYENGVMKTETGLEFFHYTFYVKNIGNKIATYEMKINISDRTRAKDASGRSLDDTLRVMVFENDPDSGKHDYLIYAKKSLINNYDIDGKETDREFIYTDDKLPNRETENYRLVDKNFKDIDTVAEYKVANFSRNDIKRYTIVFWLEGGDPQSDPEQEYPEGATLKLGVDISAYENNA